MSTEFFSQVEGDLARAMNSKFNMLPWSNKLYWIRKARLILKEFDVTKKAQPAAKGGLSKCSE